MLRKSFDLYLNTKIKKINNKIIIDSDKSISIRSFLIGAISNNISSVKNVLESDDVMSTIDSLKKLGVKIKKKGEKKYIIYGKGLGSLSSHLNQQLNFGNSGTLARLLVGILSTTPNINIKIKGDHSLNKRSMKKLIILMSNFGATFLPKKKFKLPLRLVSSSMPIGINYKAGVSAQLKSAVILAGLNSYGNTKITELKKSRDHTENMLLRNSQSIRIKKGNNKLITIFGKKQLEPIKINVPGDPSSAAFFAALSLLKEKSSLEIENVGLNPTRIGFYQILKKHGAKIKFLNKLKQNNEISGKIVINCSKIKPLKVSKKYYTNSTDEYPIMFVIAALTKGTSVFKGIKDLANKESNRITEMQKILNQLNIKSSFSNDTLKIFGKGLFSAKDKHILVKNLGDHRICMSSFVLALLTGAKLKIKNFETVFTSSPSFLKNMKKLGVKFEIQKL